MHCPKCGQQQISEVTRFCSRCGFLLTGIAQVVANDGIIPASSGKRSFLPPSSPRRRGVMQGAFVFLLAFLVVPLVMIISIGLRLGPAFAMLSSVLLVMGGLLRMAYAMMFESGIPTGSSVNEEQTANTQQAFSRAAAAGQLPTASSLPVDLYTSPAQGSWRDTNDLVATPGSVTDSTTKLLERDQ